MNVVYSGARWRKSGRSGNQGQCVEVANVGEVVAIRDSKNPDGPKLAFTRREMAEFATRVKSGRLDA